MRLDPDTCYDALLSRNRRFDGWFFVGVATTGVASRPHRARVPSSVPHAARRAPWRAYTALHVWRLHGDVLR